MAISAVRAVAGAGRVQFDCQPSMASEDFAFMLQAKPGACIWLGADGANASPPLHNPHRARGRLCAVDKVVVVASTGRSASGFPAPLSGAPRAADQEMNRPSLPSMEMSVKEVPNRLPFV
ncbi:hypothetical protein AVXHC19_31450 [Acidovorax sacchari]